MSRNETLQFVLCAVAILTSVGCGDAAAGSACEERCQRADSCPNLVADSDCVSVCEEVVEQAQALGGTCPGAIDDVVACHTGLSCSELTARVTSSFYDDECVALEQAAQRCQPGDPVDTGSSPDPEPVDELTLACDAACTAIDACPTTRAEVDCLQICVDGYGAAGNGSAACRAAIIDTVNCQAGMTCQEIENRVRGLSSYDTCRAADDRAAALCVGS